MVKDKALTRMRKRHVVESAKAETKRAKVMTDVLKPLLKRYGADALMTVANQSRVVNVQAIPTGWQELDDLLTGETDERSRTVKNTGIGMPRGRIVEISGPEASGKTTLALHIVAAAQRAGLLCAFVDAEHALDAKYAANLGVDLSKLVLNQPSSAEQGLDIVRDLARSGEVGVIVVDSVAAIEPEVEQKKRMSDSIVAAQARLMSSALRRLIAVCARTQTLLIFTNQLREKIGVMFGNPETTPGGKALKFYASVRLDVRLVKQIKKAGHKIGHRARIRATKNKVAPPFREVFADIFPNIGIKTVYGDPDFDDSDDDDAKTE